MSKPRRTSDGKYDTTQLEPSQYSRYVHRDYAAHFFRWGFASRAVVAQARELKRKIRILDVGCGEDAPMATVLSFHGPWNDVLLYLGVDVKPLKKKPKSGWIQIMDEFDFTTRWKEVRDLGPFDVMTCFEAIEHMDPEAGARMLRAGRRMLTPETGRWYLSTPTFDGVHKAECHIQEYTVEELAEMIDDAGLDIERRHGTFGNVKALEKAASSRHRAVMDELAEYYGNDVMSTIFAPLYPDASRNNIWVLKRREEQ